MLPVNPEVAVITPTSIKLPINLFAVTMPVREILFGIFELSNDLFDYDDT